MEEKLPVGDAVAIPEIDVSTLAERRAGGARIIDVREPDEYEEVHVPGVELMPLATVPDRLEDIGDGPVLLICKSGGRSMQAAEFLAAQGVDVTNVAGGTMAWVDAGFETASGSEPG
jgi:rhodanese-related sulfurtransferase